MIHSTCTTVWFYVFFVYQFWEYFQVLHSCLAFDVTDVSPQNTWFNKTAWKSFKGFLLPPSSLCRCLLPADSSTKQAGLATGMYIQPCYPVFHPLESPCALWEYCAIRQLTERYKGRFGKVYSIGLSPWTSRDSVLSVTFKGLQSTRSHSLKELKVHETLQDVPHLILHNCFFSGGGELFSICLILSSKILYGRMKVNAFL